MRTQISASFLFLSQVYGSLLGDTAVVERDDSTDAVMKRYMDSIIAPYATLNKRQSTVNVTEWNEKVLSSCSSQLRSLEVSAINPSGVAACYNIPHWDTETGVFHADLRLFRVSEPTGQFNGISAEDIQVDMSYASASVSIVDNSALRRRGVALPSMSLPRSVLGKREEPALSETYAFYGKINQDLVGSEPASIRKALVPTIKLSGVDAQGETVSTTLSMSEAAFIVGSFAQQKAVTQASNNVSPPLQTLVVGPGEKFVVPGLNILITPVGLIVTSIWAVLLITTISYGTVRRIQFKDQYRRRIARVTKGRMATI